jgi:hypothetical protein
LQKADRMKLLAHIPQNRRSGQLVKVHRRISPPTFQQLYSILDADKFKTSLIRMLYFAINYQTSCALGNATLRVAVILKYGAVKK